jgi:hypothetical protein
MGLVNTLKSMVHEKRVGFAMDEVMTGTHEFVKGKGPAGDHPMEYRVTWGHRKLADWFNPFGGEFMTNTLFGKVDVGGLAIDAECKGTLELCYFTEAKIRYTFEFANDEGKKYKYVGEKKGLRPWNLHRTHTTCYGQIIEVESGEVISEGIVYFRFATIPAFMLSFRLV